MFDIISLEKESGWETLILSAVVTSLMTIDNSKQ